MCSVCVLLAVLFADLGVVLDNSFFFTVQDLVMNRTAARNATTGKDCTWGVWSKAGADVLITGFHMLVSCVQDISVQVRPTGNGIGQEARNLILAACSFPHKAEGTQPLA